MSRTEVKGTKAPFKAADWLDGWKMVWSTMSCGKDLKSFCQWSKANTRHKPLSRREAAAMAGCRRKASEVESFVPRKVKWSLKIPVAFE